MNAAGLMKRCKELLVKHLFVCVLCIGTVMVLIVFMLRFGLFSKPGEVTIDASSLLTDVIDIADLSTAEFRYRGIADIYSDENRTQLYCRVCYNSVVKAGIDVQKMQFDVDSEAKVIYAVLPDIELKVTIIDEQSMALLPSNANVEIDRMLKFSKEDAEIEARQSQELINTARDNVKATIEGLLFPILKNQGFSLVWN